MKRIDEQALKIALSSGQQTDALRKYRVNLSNDRTDVIFDKRTLLMLKKYAKNPVQVEKVRDYLNDLSDDDGFPFSQSLKQYDKLKAQLDKFAEKDHDSFRWNRNYQKALKQVLKLFARYTKLRQLDYYCDDDIIQAIPKSDTHSGFSFLVTGKKYKGEYFDGIYQMYSREERDARINKSFNKPILPGTRTQASGAFDDIDGTFTHKCKHKTRLVSMIDINVIIAELKFAKPFQNLLAHLEFYAGGKDDAALSNRIANLRKKYPRWCSLDYSSFDQTISRWLIEDAFKIIRSCFYDDGFDEELFSVIQNDFIEKNFITADGIVFSKKGVPSGSMFTQIVDSIVNLICVFTYFNAKGINGECFIMGDDNLVFTYYPIDKVDISSYLKHNLGLIVNPDKTDDGISGAQPPRFLSREWRNIGQWRHPNVLISKLLYPERYRPYESGEVKPEDIIYGYYLTYRSGMDELIDVVAFFKDYPFRKHTFGRVVSRYVPGALQFNMMYLMPRSYSEGIANRFDADMRYGLKSAV